MTQTEQKRADFIEAYGSYISVVKDAFEKMLLSLQEPFASMITMLTTYTGEHDEHGYIMGDPFEGTDQLMPIFQILYTIGLLLTESHEIDTHSPHLRLRSSVYENSAYPIKFPQY